MRADPIHRCVSCSGEVPRGDQDWFIRAPLHHWCALVAPVTLLREWERLPARSDWAAVRRPRSPLGAVQ